jgi:hypothetical protein
LLERIGKEIDRELAYVVCPDGSMD